MEGTRRNKEGSRNKKHIKCLKKTHLFQITNFYLIRHMQLLNLNIALKICQPPMAVLQVFAIMECPIRHLDCVKSQKYSELKKIKEK